MSDTEHNETHKEQEEFFLPRRYITSLKMPPEGGASALFLGSTRSGKTTLIKAFYEYHFKNHITILHTCSPQAKTYDELKKSVALSPEFCPKAIEECMKINMKLNNRYEFLHIIDDCVSSKNDKTMVRLLTIGRNHNQSTLISGQSLTILNSIGRTNINFVFLGKLNSSMGIEQCIKAYLQGIFPSDMRMADKIKLYHQLTSDYNWIVIDCIGGDVFLTKLNV